MRYPLQLIIDIMDKLDLIGLDSDAFGLQSSVVEAEVIFLLSPGNFSN